jgi:hypothetical protein
MPYPPRTPGGYRFLYLLSSSHTSKEATKESRKLFAINVTDYVIRGS